MSSNVINPPYPTYTLADLSNIPKTGLNVASLFSGGGGSSLGYKLAGHNVIYAAEFIEAAYQCYRLNFPNTYVDTRDVRAIAGQDILDVLYKTTGATELDILDGSPPCSGFSSCNMAKDKYFKVKRYSTGGKKQRVDDLFWEFIRVLREVRPKAFVSENVPALAEGKHRNRLKLFLRDYQEVGYTVRAWVLNAVNFDCATIRRRLFITGYRNDLEITPQPPTPSPHIYTLRDAVGEYRFNLNKNHDTIRDLPNTRRFYQLWLLTMPGDSMSVAREKTAGRHTFFNHYRLSWDKPCYTISTRPSLYHPDEFRYISIREAAKVSSFPDDYKFFDIKKFTTNYERIGRAVPPRLMSAIAKSIGKKLIRV